VLKILQKVICTVGGFNFIIFGNFNRNQTENDRYWQKNNFLLFAKCLKMFSFIRICILSLQKVGTIMTQKKIFFKNINMGIKKRNFMLISNLLMRAFRNTLNKVKSKKPRKYAQKRKYSKFA
jgi:hypothetical protein